jgi:hypothetical protein
MWFHTLRNIPNHKPLYSQRCKAVWHPSPAGTPYVSTSSDGIVPANPPVHSLSVTMMSRLMLNLHTAAYTGIFSTALTSDTSTGAAFTSHAPDNLLFEMQSMMPTQSLQAGGEHIVREIEVPEMEVEQRNGT